MSKSTIMRGRKRANSSFSTGSTIGVVESSDASSTTGSIETSTSSRIADFWLHHEHNGFTPNPRASVHEEIKRLADSKGWSYRTMMKRRKEALAAEIALHDDGKDRLERWQQLCVEVGVADLDDLPKSISACKKVSLKSDSKAMSHSVLPWLTRFAGARRGAHQHLQPRRPSTKPPNHPSSSL